MTEQTSTDQKIHIVIENRDGKETVVLATHDEKQALWSVFEEIKFNGEVWREIHTYVNGVREGWNMSVTTGITYCVTQYNEDDGEYCLVYVGEDYRMVEFLQSLPNPDCISYSVEKWQNGKRLDE